MPAAPAIAPALGSITVTTAASPVAPSTGDAFGKVLRSVRDTAATSVPAPAPSNYTQRSSVSTLLAPRVPPRVDAAGSVSAGTDQSAATRTSAQAAASPAVAAPAVASHAVASPALALAASAAAPPAPTAAAADATKGANPQQTVRDDKRAGGSQPVDVAGTSMREDGQDANVTPTVAGPLSPPAPQPRHGGDPVPPPASAGTGEYRFAEGAVAAIGHGSGGGHDGNATISRPTSLRGTKPAAASGPDNNAASATAAAANSASEAAGTGPGPGHVAVDGVGPPAMPSQVPAGRLAADPVAASAQPSAQARRMTGRAGSVVGASPAARTTRSQPPSPPVEPVGGAGKTEAAGAGVASGQPAMSDMSAARAPAVEDGRNAGSTDLRTGSLAARQIPNVVGEATSSTTDLAVPTQAGSAVTSGSPGPHADPAPRVSIPGSTEAPQVSAPVPADGSRTPAQSTAQLAGVQLPGQTIQAPAEASDRKISLRAVDVGPDLAQPAVAPGVLPDQAAPLNTPAAVPDAASVAATPPAHPASVASPADQVAPALLTMAKTSDGNQEMTVRLHPGDLGMVQVKIERSAAGATQIGITADNPATLLAMQRDQPQRTARWTRPAFRPRGEPSRSISWTSRKPLTTAAVRRH